MNLHPLILRDHYRRWWWAHLVGFLWFGALGVAVGFGLDPHKIPLGIGAFLGAVTLAVELNARTNARTLLSFPVRASELGTTWWWIAVPLSALAPAAGLAVGWTVSGLFGSTVPVDVAALLRFLLLTQSVSAFQFTVLCFMPNADTSNPREKILGGFTGAFWGSASARVVRSPCSGSMRIPSGIHFPAPSWRWARCAASCLGIDARRSCSNEPGRMREQHQRRDRWGGCFRLPASTDLPGSTSGGCFVWQGSDWPSVQWSGSVSLGRGAQESGRRESG